MKKENQTINWYYREHVDSADYGIIGYHLSATIESEHTSNITYKIHVDTCNGIEIKFSDSSFYSNITEQNCKRWLADAKTLTKQFETVWRSYAEGYYLFQAIEHLQLKNDHLQSEPLRAKLRLLEQKAQLYKTTRQAEALKFNIEQAEQRAA